MVKQPLRYLGDLAPDGALTPFRVTARDKVSAEAVQELTETPHIEVTDDPALVQAAIIRGATKYRVAKELEGYDRLMYVVRAGVGVDNIDMPLAAQNGIATANTPGASTDAVAKRSLMLMLAWAGRIVQGTQALRHSQWPKNQPDVEPVDLSQKTLGIVGYGRIGQKVHELAKPHFGRILFSDVRAIEGSSPLEELLAQADVVSLNVSGSQEILSPALMVKLKPTALIVNTARGTVVNPQALLRHMDGGGAAALDVYPKEGAAMFESPEVQGITQHPNFLGTPHTAAADAVTQTKLGIEAAQRVVEFAQEGTVNPGNLPGHTLPRVSLHEVEPEENGNGNGGEKPRVRLIMTHPSVPGVLQGIQNAIATVGRDRGRQVNIIDQQNREGKIGTPPLAMTLTDLELGNDEREIALQVHEAIAREVPLLKARAAVLG